MVHRSTPLHSAFRSYTGGGSRSTVDKVDDMHFMQEFGGNIMSGESAKGIEAAQNYGFTSVCMQATKDAMGKIIDGAEVALQHLGGARGYPIGGNMDDRRHRLWGLDPGDSALFRTATDHLQLHMHKDGGFWSGAIDKTLRMALVDEQSGQQQQQMQQRARRRQLERERAAALTANGGGGGGGGASSDGEPEDKNGNQKGQKSLQQQNTQSKRFIHITKDEAAHSGTNVRAYLDDGVGYHEVNKDKNVYVGALKGKASFGKIVTTKGPMKNGWGKVG